MIGRLLLVGLLAMVAIQAAWPADMDRCDTTCPDDDEQGRCVEANCCPCCAPQRLTLVALCTEHELTAATLVLPARPSKAPLPEPRDILHVPKPALS